MSGQPRDVVRCGRPDTRLVAQWTTRCALCTCVIRPGDRIAMRDRQAVHAGCVR